MKLPTKNTLLQSATSQPTKQSSQERIFSLTQEKLKNKKFPSLQKNKTLRPHKPRQTETNLYGGQLATQYLRAFNRDTDDRKIEALGGNTGFAKAGVQCLFDSELGNQTFVILMNDSAEKPRLRKARKR